MRKLKGDPEGPIAHQAGMMVKDSILQSEGVARFLPLRDIGAEVLIKEQIGLIKVT